MAQKKRLLDRMRDNPRSDWKMADIERLCAELGLVLHPPSRGSHFKVVSEFLADVLVIPARRPIKAVYIRTLTSFADAHVAHQLQEDQDDR